MSVLSTFAADVAAAAGGVARRRFYAAQYRVKRKSGGEPVTEVDREVEQFIADRIAAQYPDHGFLGEESGAVGNQQQCWVVDPIDGTTNFVHQYERFSVSVAFCDNGIPIAGAVHDIIANETFVAAKGEGAFLHNRRLRVSATSSFGRSLFVAGGVLDDAMWGLIKELSRRTDGVRRSGSTALDLACVAAGRADMLVCGRVRFWDVAAGALLLREAGGLLSDIDERTTFAFAEPTQCFVGGAPGVFAPYIGALKKHRS